MSDNSETKKPRPKRVPIVNSAPYGELKACWGREMRGETPAVQYAWSGEEGGSRKADGRVLSMALEECKILDDKNLIQILRERGYDISTLRFSVKKKPMI